MSRFLLRVAVGALSLGLIGCVSPREMYARHERACSTYGFQPGTEGYANCLLQLEVSDYGYSHHGRGPIFILPPSKSSATPP